MATEAGPDTHEGNGEKKDNTRLAQTVAMWVQLWLGLGLIAVFFLGWLAGTAIMSLGLGITLILIDFLSNSKRGHDRQ